ncbi:MAG TPA: ATP-binding protein [Myxococcota bacterium]|nr:ATP-binding protein [Myxococcota bacterium]
MDFATLAGLATTIVALYTALFHGSIFFMRRSAHEHLWFAAMASAVACFALSGPAFYGTRTASEGAFHQGLQIASFAGVMVSFTRFSLAYLKLERPLLVHMAAIFALLYAAFALFTPWFFSGIPIVHHAGRYSREFTESEISIFGGIALTCMVGFFVYVIALYLRNRSRPDVRVKPVLATLALWLAVGLNDWAVVSRLYDAPYLLPFGYLGVVIVISGVLVGRLVQSMDDAEHLAANLHELVEERTAELRQKDLQLAQGEKMAAIGTLAAGIAHEINNPMAFVTSNLNRLAELWNKPEEGSDVDEIMAECREGTTRVRDIVSNLLQVTRQSEGRIEPVDLCRVVRQIFPILRQEARFRAQLRAELTPVPPVIGDADLLGQVVLNLTLNALHAIEEGAPSENEVVVSTALEGDRVLLRVRDTGSGIAPEAMPRIFDPFFTTKQSGQGTGLGLAISHRIVSQHRGTIHVESGGRGSLFTVALPAHG